MKDNAGTLPSIFTSRKYYPYNKCVYTEVSGNSNQGGWGATTLRANMNSASGTVYGLAPEKLRDALVTVQKRYFTGSANGTTAGIGSLSISPDKMFLASYSELALANSAYSPFGGLLSQDPSRSEGAQYEFYRLRGVRGDKIALNQPGNPETDINYADNLSVVRCHVLPNNNIKTGDEKIDTKVLRTYSGAGTDFQTWTAGYTWESWERSVSPTDANRFVMSNYNGTVYGHYQPSFYFGISPCFCF